MDQNSKLIENFEDILRKRSARKPVALYNGHRNPVSKGSGSKNSITVREILADVSKQLKAIQDADCIEVGKRVPKNMSLYKKSDFVPVNMLPRHLEVPPQCNMNNFDTQCVSGTQLINVVQDAEALDAPMGVTQEFDSTFCSTYIEERNYDIDNDTENMNNLIDNKYSTDIIIENQDAIESEIGYETQNNCENFDTQAGHFQIIDISLKEPDPNLKNFNLSINDNEVTDDEVDLFVKDDLIDKVVEGMNECVENEDNKLVVDDLDMPSSPVFHIKPTTKKTTPLLVFDLELFEKFERMVTPLVEKNLDFETTRFLINSQIIGKELTINADTKPMFLQFEEQNSPARKILNLDDSMEIFTPEHQDTEHKDECIVNGEVNESKFMINDEILFSSDEDEAYVHKEIQELPLTCALESSFTTISEVLDKSMFVGFQTASNKSIQICTDSFYKAKTIFDDMNIGNREPTFSELVKSFDEELAICGSLQSSKSQIMTEYVDSNKTRTEHTIDEAVLDEFVNNGMLELIKDRNLDKQTVGLGFKTASNKNVKISEYAVAKTRKIFEDINLIETDTNMNKNEHEASIIGFRTASNKRIIISEHALMKTKDVFQDVGNINKLDVKETDQIRSEAENILPPDVFKKPSTSKAFTGFKTASNRVINISDEALSKTMDIFQDIDTESFKDSHLRKDTVNLGFWTASNKKVKISATAMAKSKKIFQDIDSETNNHFEDIEAKIVIPTKSFIEFKTASNNDFNILEEVLIKSKIMFKDPQSTDAFDEDNSNMSEKEVPEGFKGFQTASKKPVKVCAEALSKSKSTFQCIDTEIPGVLNAECDNLVPKENSNNTDKETPGFKGFQTDSKKPVKISAQALAKSKAIFQSIDEKMLEVTNATSDNLASKDISNNAQKEITGSFKGFQTASKKPVKISTEALTRSKAIFQGIDEEITGVTNAGYVNLVPKYISNTDKETLGFIGFQTASKKPVKISAQALAKSKAIFQSIDENILEVTNATSDNLASKDISNNAQKEITGSFKGFQTASKKPVKISTEALTRSKAIFQGIDEEITGVTNARYVNLVPKYISNTDKETLGCNGFQTASKKPVKISAQALAKSKAIFQSSDEKILEVTNATSDNLASKDISNNAQKEITGSFKGFQTASNKPVKISTEALTRSKAIFQGIDEEITGVTNARYVNLVPKYISNTDKETLGFNGFQTASKKPVKISAEALAKSKAIFQGIDEEIPEITSDGNDNILSQIISFPAGYKEVNISDITTVNKGRKFQDVTEKVYLNNTEDNVTEPIFRAFQTANNKTIKTSEILLAKRRKTLDEIDHQEANEIVQKPTSFGGFQTANNKQVLISAKALGKSKRLFQDLDFEDGNSLMRDFKKTKLNTEVEKDNFEITTTKIPIFGFQTGNNTEIKVTEAALQISRKLLGDVDDDAEKSSKKSLNQQTCVKVFNNNDVNATRIINAQVLNNFEESLHPEDFCKVKTPVKTSKRSGSPILSCPKAKKRKKFETPYSQSTVTEIGNIKNNNQKLKIPENFYHFDANYKKTKKYNLQDLLKLEKDTVDLEMNLDPYITKFNFDNLQLFEFSAERNDIAHVKWTITNLKTHFLDSVNQKLVPDGWVDNHILLILRKLISYEIGFPKTMARVCTTKNVMEQLKYRYDKELYNSERPCLRKILEKDDVSTRTMVLCVAAVLEDGASITGLPITANNVELAVTDGWYCLKATIDQMLTQLILEGKIAVGTKIVTSGADLVNCEQGVAPWEDTSSIRLKLHGNSTRRARIHARLGRHGNEPARPLRLVEARGGRVARLRVLVARVYPALYVEKFADGSTVTRSERMERLQETRHESERQAVLEKLYEEVEKEFADHSDSPDPDESSDCSGLETGSQVARGMKASRDPAEFRTHLTESQRTLLLNHTTKQREALLQDIQRRVAEKIEHSGLNVNRNVVALLKIRVVGVEERGEGRPVEVTRAMMSIWRPNDAVQEIVKEGSWIEVTDVVPTAVRYSEIQLSVGRQSIFCQCKKNRSEKIKAYESALKRTCYTIKDLANLPAATTDYNEIDTVGLIFSIEPSNKEFDMNKHQFQNVFLCDVDKNIISVNFWGGSKKFGFENVLDTAEIVSCANLQKRAGNTRKSIPQYRVTEFSYFTKVPKNEFARVLAEDLSKKLSCVNVARFCEYCVMLKNNYSATKPHRYTENISPYRFQSVDANLSRNKIFIDSPLTDKKVDDNLSLTGLDFESTFKQDTLELSPKTMLRKKQVREKIEKLKMYGEPPSLSPIQVLNRSKNAGNAFKSPLVSKYESSVAGEKKILLTEPEIPAIQQSPELNRTFVKRTVNPVKLNFSSSVAMEESDINDVVDHFAEDFDGSPPLSLD